MKPITVAMEVKPTGEIVREAFTMVHSDNKFTEDRRDSLVQDFESGTYKDKWRTPRVEIGDAIHRRGNKLACQSYLFG